MKINKIASALLASSAAMFCAGASADTGYVSVRFGQSHIDANCSGAASCKVSDTALKLTGGYHLDGRWAAELGYIDFGKYSANDGAGLSSELKASAITVGAAYTVPFAAQWSANLRLGMAIVKTDTADWSGPLNTYSASETATTPYAGLGLDYALSKNLKVGLGADVTQSTLPGVTHTLYALSLGLSYGF